jgi:hypothetical protein
MGAIGDVVALLSGSQYLKHPPGIEGALGDYATHQAMDLRQRQARGVFLSGTAAEPEKSEPGCTGSDADATPATSALRRRPCPGTACPPRSRFRSASACRSAGPVRATVCPPRHGSDRSSVPQSARDAAESNSPPAPAAHRGRQPHAPRRNRPRSALCYLP